MKKKLYKIYVLYDTEGFPKADGKDMDELEESVRGWCNDVLIKEGWWESKMDSPIRFLEKKLKWKVTEAVVVPKPYPSEIKAMLAAEAL